MEKFSNFDEALQLLLGFNPKLIDKTSIPSKIDGFLKTGCQLEALLLTIASLDTENWSEEIAPYFKKITGYEAVLEEAKLLRWSQLEEPIEDMVKRNDFSLLHEIALKVFLVRPLANTTAVAFFLLEATVNKNDPNRLLVNEIAGFYSQYSKVPELLFKAFRFFESHRNTGWKKRALQLISQKCAEWGAEDILLSLYWYYTYLGDSEVSEITFEHLTHTGSDDEFQLSFFEKFSWREFPFEHMKKKYEFIVKWQMQIISQEKFQEAFKGRGLHYLIPLCLYAKCMGDTETEATLLWFVIMKCNSEALFSRLEELSGVEISMGFKRLPFEERIEWYKSTLDDCSFYHHNKRPTVSRIISCKHSYSLRPYHLETLRNLLCVVAFNDNVEAKFMLDYAIRRISSPLTLEKLATTAIELQCEYGLKLVASRFILLDLNLANPKEVMGEVWKIYKRQTYIQYERDVKTVNFILQALDFYRTLSSEKAYDVQLHRITKNDCEKWLKESKATGLGLVSETEMAAILLERKALRMLKNGNYADLMNWLNDESPFSIGILEIMLQAALALGLGERILFVYRTLAKRDPLRAGFYNIDVAPYVRASNRRTKEITLQGSSNLVSTVWQLPGIIENPVDRKTRRIVK